MKLSAFIKQLQQALAERGDIEVTIDRQGKDVDPELYYFDGEMQVY